MIGKHLNIKMFMFFTFQKVSFMSLGHVTVERDIHLQTLIWHQTTEFGTKHEFWKYYLGEL